MKKRKSAILFIALIIMSLAFITSCENSDKNSLKGIEGYNAEGHPVPEWFFLSEIPEYANPVDFFSYYNAFTTEQDVYLELTFENEADLWLYIDAIKENFSAYQKRTGYKPIGSNEGWYIEEKNPYDSSYTDIFNVLCAKNLYNRNYIGYHTYPIAEGVVSYNLNFAVISYSIEEKTIVQSLSFAQYYDGIGEYFPKYFERFGISFKSENFDRIVYSCDDDPAVNAREIVDLTERMDNFMQEKAQIMLDYKEEHGYIKAALYFYEMVDDEGEWDIKLKDEWGFKPGARYFYKGTELRYDDHGNICFAYIGATLFSKETLCLGAGINQTTKFDYAFGNIFTWYDDPRDRIMIQYGHDLYTKK